MSVSRYAFLITFCLRKPPSSVFPIIPYLETSSVAEVGYFWLPCGQFDSGYFWLTDLVDKLILITGLTIRSSEIIPEMREAYFKCSVCDSVEKSVLYRSKINEPTECKNCHSKLFLPALSSIGT